MRYLKDSVSRMIAKVGSFRRILAVQLEDDVTMASMNLSHFKYDNIYFLLSLMFFCCTFMYKLLGLCDLRHPVFYSLCITLFLATC